MPNIRSLPRSEIYGPPLRDLLALLELGKEPRKSLYLFTNAFMDAFVQGKVREYQGVESADDIAWEEKSKYTAFQEAAIRAFPGLTKRDLPPAKQLYYVLRSRLKKHTGRNAMRRRKSRRNRRSNFKLEQVLTYIYKEARRPIKDYLKDSWIKNVRSKIYSKAPGYSILEVHGTYERPGISPGDFTLTVELKEEGQGTKLYMTAFGEGEIVAPRPVVVKDLGMLGGRVQDDLRRKIMTDVIQQWIRAYSGRGPTSSRRTPRRARGPQLQVGDRVEVLSGPLTGVKVTIRDIDGSTALVSATAHGRKNKVPLRDLEKIAKVQAKIASQLIRLGEEKPELQRHLSPVLDALTGQQGKEASNLSHFKVYGMGEFMGGDYEIESALEGYGFTPDDIFTDGDDLIVEFRGPDAYDEAADAVGRLARKYRLSNAFRGGY